MPATKIAAEAHSICPKCKTLYTYAYSPAKPSMYFVCERATSLGCPGGKLIPYQMEKEEEDELSPKVKIAPICYGCKKPVCEACNECEECNCQLVGKFVTSKAQMFQLGLALPKTQKALGFIKLRSVFDLTTPIPFTVITEESDIDFIEEYDAFIRPCPVRPRHGFVESVRLPSTKDNLKKVWDAARAADSNAEVIVCKAIDAKMNAIITPGMVAVGPGNAGATGGRESVSIPLLGVLPPEISDKAKLLSVGVDLDTHDPYLELVRDANSSWIYTQLRAGSKVPKAPDYIPERIRVERIVEASGDLLEWEEQVKTIERGTVVVHVGGSVISHYGVHCITNKIPIMTTRMPVVGEVLEEAGIKVEYEPALIIKGLALGVMIPTTSTPFTTILSMKELLPLMMTTLHNAPAMGNGYGIWTGFAVSIMLRAGMAASHGEARHADSSMKSSYTRTRIYETALKDFFGARNTLNKAQFAFLNHKWSSSFGGKAWAKCTQSVIDLDTAARALINIPNEINRVALINALNTAVNQAHNGGWWLNKFIEHERFSEASEQSLSALQRVASILIPVNDYFKSVKEEDWKAVAKQWGELGDIVVEAPPAEFKAKRIDEDDEDSDDGDEPEVDYDESIGIDPTCCEDCKYSYDKAFAKKQDIKAADAEPDDVVDSPPPYPLEPITTGKQLKKTPQTVLKATKAPFNKGGVVVKAHARFEYVGNLAYNTHIQCLLTNGHYWSFDVQVVGKPLPYLSTLPLEVSYSSSAGGYIDMDIIANNTLGISKLGTVFKINPGGYLEVEVWDALEKGSTSNGAQEAAQDSPF